LDQPLIRSINRPNDWRLWLNDADPTLPEPKRFLDVENSMLACQAALDGLGIAILVTPAFAETDLARRRLIAPIAHKLKTGQSYRLGWLKSNADRPGVKAFREWILGEIAQHNSQAPTGKSAKVR
jgi:DNA-binding transcriptional LysR family regulator